MGFDRTAIFITTRMKKYIEQLNSIKRKMNGKVDYFVINDNFDQHYENFKRFLSPYLINNQQLPYIN
jgi:guanylate kinase